MADPNPQKPSNTDPAPTQTSSASATQPQAQPQPQPQSQPLYIDLHSPELRSLHDMLTKPPLRSPTAARDAERKKNSAGADWKPSFERKTSFSREDRKQGVGGGWSGGSGSGFTERDDA
jgi:hypothetical protein